MSNILALLRHGRYTLQAHPHKEGPCVDAVYLLPGTRRGTSKVLRAATTETAKEKALEPAMRASSERSSTNAMARDDSGTTPPTPHEEQPLLRPDAEALWKPPVGFVWIQLGWLLLDP